MELCFVVGKSEGANELLNFCINPTELNQFVNLSNLLEYPSIRQWYLRGTHFHANQNPPQLIHYIDSSGRQLKRVKQLSDGSHLSVPFADDSMRHRLPKSPTAISTDNYRHIFSFQLANGYIWYVAEHGGMPDLACFMATTQYVDLMLMYESGYGSLGYRFGEAIKRKQILSV